MVDDSDGLGSWRMVGYLVSQVDGSQGPLALASGQGTWMTSGSPRATLG
jgi:hypothetical protein